MEIALLDFFDKNIHWFFAGFIVVITELWKRLSVKHGDKWYLKLWADERLVGFNLRALVGLQIVLFGIAVVVIQKDFSILKDFIKALGVGITSYELLYKSFIKKFNLNNYVRE